MSKKQPEKDNVFVKYKLDSTSDLSSKKLESKSFSESVARDFALLIAPKSKTQSGRG